MDETKKFFELLSKIMDESLDNNNSEIIQTINDIKIIVDEQLIPAIEEIQYAEKYSIINKLKRICQNISLYLFFPELIGKNIIGFYQPSGILQKAIYARYVQPVFDNNMNIRTELLNDESDLGKKGRRNIFLNGIPTILANEDEKSLISMLNIANKSINIPYFDYIELLKNIKHNEIEISKLVNLLLIPIKNSKKNQIITVIPENCDKNNKYYTSLCESLDILIVRGEDATVENLQQFPYISTVFVQGKVSSKKIEFIKAYCENNNISLILGEHDLFDVLASEKYNQAKNNFCYKYIIENLLYEISWYISNQKYNLEKSIAMINDDLLFKDIDSKAGNLIKRIQIQYSNNINGLSEIYYHYKEIVDVLIDKIEKLQLQFNIKESINCLNTHINQPEKYVELLIKISSTLKEFPQSNSKEIVREYKALSSKKYELISNLIFSLYVDESINKEVINSMLKKTYSSDYIKRAQVNIGFDCNGNLDSIIDILQKIRLPLTGKEKYILGKWYIKQGKKDEALEYLNSALHTGEIEAGELLVSIAPANNDYLKELADYGVSSAAYKVGKNMYLNKDYDYTKYLHIAAAKKNMNAIKFLGYTEFEKSKDLKDEAAKKALHYYKIAEKNGSIDKQMFERMLKICYANKEYKSAVEYCKKAKTGEAYYYLGMINQNGLGCACNETQALKYYEKAIKEGHMNAQVEYERLMAKIAKEKAKTVVEENKSYSSYTYYSGGYYSSGW